METNQTSEILGLPNPSIGKRKRILTVFGVDILLGIALALFAPQQPLWLFYLISVVAIMVLCFVGLPWAMIGATPKDFYVAYKAKKSGRG